MIAIAIITKLPYWYRMLSPITTPGTDWSANCVARSVECALQPLDETLLQICRRCSNRQ